MSDPPNLPPDFTPPNAEPPAGAASQPPQTEAPTRGPIETEAESTAGSAEKAGPSSSPLPEPTHDERILGMLAQFLQIISWFIAPGIILLVRRDSRFVRYHALQALFFHLLVVIVGAAAALALYAGWFSGAARDDLGSAFAAIFFPVILFLVLGIGGALSWLLSLVLGVVYGLRANNGEWAGYPGIKYLAAKVAGVELPR